MIGFKKNPADVVFGIRSYAYCHNTRLNAYVSLEQGNRTPPPPIKARLFAVLFILYTPSTFDRWKLQTFQY